MKLNRVAVAAGVIVTGLTLAACGSSGGASNPGSSGGTTPTTSGSTGGSGDVACASGTLNGSGSTAQTNAMDAWRKAYQQACSGTTINYDSVGSGDGIAAFTAGNADFAGSDAALDPASEMKPATQQCGSPAIDLPMVVGPVAIVFNLKGVKSLTLNASTIAQIFEGKITKWNDSAIAALNKGVTLPSTSITPFYRSDDSGTTYNFSSYLKAAAPKDFTKTPDKVSKGLGFAGQGRDGSQGIADSVTQTDGGVGYVEFSYAVKAQLPFAAIDSGSGAVTLSKDSAAKAVSTAKIVGKGNDLSLSIDYAQNTPGAYPLILVTYEIACTKYKDSSTGTFVKDFLDYTASDAGQNILPQLGYAPLPTNILTKVRSSISKIS